MKKQGLCYLELVLLQKLWKKSNNTQKNKLLNPHLELFGIPNNSTQAAGGFQPTLPVESFQIGRNIPKIKDWRITKE